MEHYLPDTCLDKIQRFDNAVFYCINSSSERIPVGIVRNFSVLPDDRLEFSLSHFPVLESSWNVFAAELHCYKKGLPFNMDLFGTAWFVNQNELTVQFKLAYSKTFGRPELRNYAMQNSFVDLFGLTSLGLFFRKMLVTGF